jgi:hypothetical protein
MARAFAAGMGAAAGAVVTITLLSWILRAILIR